MNKMPLLTDDPKALEALSRVRVLYTDLDGTLVAKGGCLLADSEGRPSTGCAEAIVDVNRAELEVVPISGRGRKQLAELVRLLGWHDFIAEAGAIIVHGVGPGSEVIYNNASWSTDDVDPTLTPYEEIARSGAVERLLEAYPGRVEYHTPWHLDREATHLLRGCLNAGEAQELIDSLEPPIGLLDNGIVRTTGTLACTEGEVAHAYHLVPKGVSKAQAIELDLASRGLTREQAAAIGDSVTDIEMADAVSVMALVSNAFDSRGVREALAMRTRPNIWRMESGRGEGWAEFARAWVQAADR